MDRLKCGCGGGGNTHFIGDPKCYRTECTPEEEPIKLPDITTVLFTWYLVEGNVITEFTLKQQRMYSQHSDGRWSRLKIPTSENSIDA